MHENRGEYDEKGGFGPKTGNGQKPEVVHNFFLRVPFLIIPINIRFEKYRSQLGHSSVALNNSSCSSCLPDVFRIGVCGSDIEKVEEPKDFARKSLLELES